jgi:hypothetical protein
MTADATRDTISMLKRSVGVSCTPLGRSTMLTVLLRLHRSASILPLVMSPFMLLRLV